MGGDRLEEAPPSPGPRGPYDAVPESPGVYVLVGGLMSPVYVPSRGGVVKLEAGRLYAYVGSAGRGLRARLSRHLEAPGRLRWHIDNLTFSRFFVVVSITWVVGPWGHPWEDKLALLLGRNAEPAAPGFGASDSLEGERLYFVEACSDAVKAARALGAGEPGCLVFAGAALLCPDWPELLDLCGSPRAP